MYALVNAGVLERADELLQDVWDIGPRAKPAYFDPVTWTEDPYHDKYWRLIFYSLRPTTNLLWAYYKTGNVTYRDKLVEILVSFTAYDATRGDAGLDDGADDAGAIVEDDAGIQTFDEDYTTSFRAMVLTNTYWKLKQSGDLPAQLDTDMLGAIGRIGNKLSSPGGYTGSFGNHGFTSAASLLLLAENFPDLTLPGSSKPVGDKWMKIGNEELTGLIANAVDSDGVDLENSPFYHYYVLTFAEQIATWAQRWNVPLPDQFVSQTHAMSTYAAYILQPDLQLPLLGSSVDTGVANLDPQVQADVAARDPEFAYMAAAGADGGSEPTERSKLFPQSGQSILRSGFGPAAEFPLQTFVTFNVGPWRNPHSHFDVLGMTYFSMGRRLLVDSGLFTYAPSPEHDYFYGTRAHNTVIVDSQDEGQGQQVIEGLTASGSSWAYQSGSHGLYAGVTHERGVLILSRDLALVVDQLSSSAMHDYAQTWHFAPDLSVQMSGLQAIATDEKGTPVLTLLQGVNSGVITKSFVAQDNPIQGWFSEHYGIKVPSVALEYHASAPSASFVTLIASGSFVTPAPRLLVDQNDGSAVRVRVCAGAFQKQVEIDHLVGTNEAVQVSDVACP
jgi:hypothetical protein